jgi:hypothetical protein
MKMMGDCSIKNILLKAIVTRDKHLPWRTKYMIGEKWAGGTFTPTSRMTKLLLDVDHNEFL